MLKSGATPERERESHQLRRCLAWLRHGDVSTWPDLKINPLVRAAEPPCLKASKKSFRT